MTVQCFNQRFFDQTLALIEAGQIELAVPMLVGNLYNAQTDSVGWPEVRAKLQRHPLHEVLLEDPYLARGYAKPRGYAGDAALIDLLYDRQLPDTVAPRGAALFMTTTAFPASEAVRLRREFAAGKLTAAWNEGQRICVLACGHFREADDLIGNDLSNVVVVDQDPLSLDVVRHNHGAKIDCVEANVFQYLRGAVARGENFDLIYTLGLTDYLDERAMRLLHRLVKTCLTTEGVFLLANFVPGHLATGWMDAVMDWHLIYRDEIDLSKFAAEADLQPRTWRDPTGTIAWCEMQR